MGHDTVVRLVNGMFVLDQAENAKIYDIKDRWPGKRFAFSHLYTALTRPGYREFLGLPEEWREEDPKPNPVPKKKSRESSRMLLWLYGSKPDGIKPVIKSQNPDLKHLGAVLGNIPSKNDHALEKRPGRSICWKSSARALGLRQRLVNAKQEAEIAWGRSQATTQKIRRFLKSAKSFATPANNSIHEHDRDGKEGIRAERQEIARAGRSG